MVILLFLNQNEPVLLEKVENNSEKYKDYMLKKSLGKLLFS